MQIAGILISIWLIAEMGILSVLFTLGLIIACIAYFYYYASKKVKRSGAIFHVHARLGKMQYEELEWEMRGILREKGLRKEDPYEKAVGRSIVIELEKIKKIEEITRQVSEKLAERVDMPTEKLVEMFHDESTEGILPVGNKTGLKHIRIDSKIDTEIVLVRIKEGLTIDNENIANLIDTEDSDDDVLHALIYLVSSSKKSGQHLRILAHLAEMIDSIDFCERWINAGDEAELREILLRDERFINLTINPKGNTTNLIHKKVKDLDLPGESLLTIIKRSGQIIFPHGNTVLREGDELSIIGEKADIEELKDQYLKS